MTFNPDSAAENSSKQSQSIVPATPISSMVSNPTSSNGKQTNGVKEPSPLVDGPSPVVDIDPFAAPTSANLNASLPIVPLVVRNTRSRQAQPPLGLLIGLAVGLMVTGFWFSYSWLSLTGATVALLISLRVIWTSLESVIAELLSSQQQTLVVALIGFVASAIGFLQMSGVTGWVADWVSGFNWEAVGALGEVIGAVGQILIAILAVYVAWRQYVISKNLTIQQNIITQQQTIDTYFQGISDLVLDEEGLLEDWPQERAIAEGRTAAILSSVDANGKAKVLRFLSRSRLLTPLQRDRRLGRPILDGVGGYAEDRDCGVRVIDLGVMMAGADLSGTDLRWADLSDVNLIRANLSRCDLVKTNFARTILCEAILAEADLMSTRFFYGAVKTATPRTKTDIPNYATGEFTGAVLEGADFSNVQRLSEDQHYYCCAWGGSATRETIPGGCGNIPNLLGR